MFQLNSNQEVVSSKAIIDQYNFKGIAAIIDNNEKQMYYHSTVNHSKSFKDPETEDYTNNINKSA